jgi:hypothetical protein
MNSLYFFRTKIERSMQSIWQHSQKLISNETEFETRIAPIEKNTFGGSVHLMEWSSFETLGLWLTIHLICSWYGVKCVMNDEITTPLGLVER